MPSTVRLTLYDSETLSGDYGTPVLQEIVRCVENGRYHTNLFKTFTFGQLHDAHRMMQENRASGKLVVLVD